MTNDLKHKLPPRAQALHDAAERQRTLCCEWLLYIMKASSERTRTKDDLRAEAIRRFKVSKSAFDFAWIDAIEKSGNHHWYEPLPRSGRRTVRTVCTENLIRVDDVLESPKLAE